jgi:hypothetical protein
VPAWGRWALVGVAALAWLAPASSLAQPREWRIEAQRARGLAVSGRCDLAIASFDRALELQPSRPDLLRDRGACHDRLGHRELAVEDYTAYCDAVPTSPDVPALRQRIVELQAAAPLQPAPPFGGAPTPAVSPAPGLAPSPPPVSAGESGVQLPPVEHQESVLEMPPAEKADEAEAPPPRANLQPVDEPLVPQGLEVGLRIGYAFPLGSEAQNINLNDVFSGVVSVWADAGYRLASPNLLLGAYFQYGFGVLGGQTANQCQSGVTCSASVVLYGAEVHYHFVPRGTFDPWIGVGVGLENVKISSPESGLSRSASLTGVDFAILQAGGDYRGVVGPCAMFGIGQYTSGSFGGLPAGIQSQALHEWFTLGVRGVFDYVP